MKIAIAQMGVDDNKQINLIRARKSVAHARAQGAELIVLPEMFICPYQNDLFEKYAEPEGGDSYQFLSDLAAEARVVLVAGSVPELGSDGKLYNTAYVFSPEGALIGKHRKVHLFDIDIPNGQRFKESETLSSGNDITVIDTPFGKMGLMICFDIRFPELAMAMVQQGAEFIVVPGAFNMTTGPAHWELLFRARALDNQVWMIGASPARSHEASYIAYGHSLVVNPWGTVVAQLNEKESLLIETIDLKEVAAIRSQLPVLSARRPNVYNR